MNWISVLHVFPKGWAWWVGEEKGKDGEEGEGFYRGEHGCQTYGYIETAVFPLPVN